MKGYVQHYVTSAHVVDSPTVGEHTIPDLPPWARIIHAKLDEQGRLLLLLHHADPTDPAVEESDSLYLRFTVLEVGERTPPRLEGYVTVLSREGWGLPSIIVWDGVRIAPLEDQP